MKTMKRALCWILVAVMVLGFMPAVTFAVESGAEVVAGREVVSLSNEWSFTEDGKTTTVTVPHNWGSSAKKEFKTCTYEKEIDVSDFEGKDVFLMFEAINQVAKVYVDGELLTTHTGGYYAFTVDITEACAGKDKVNVKIEVTNGDSTNMPVYSDFTYFGGMYRDAWLIAVDPAAYISNEDYGTSGLYAASEVDLKNGSAAVNATVMVTNDEDAVVAVEVLDADGNVVGAAETTVAAGGDVAAVELDTITIENAHLWQGTIDPYLYTVKAATYVDGEMTDCVEERIGLRTFEVVDGEFYLNGEVYELRGVGMHQDGAGDTYVTTDEQKIADLEMVQEMGANALRTAHYPHDEIVYDWCDENGIVIWNEIPNFLTMLDNEVFFEEAKYNVVEMVKQGYNYPSIIVWGVANEVNVRDIFPGAANVEQLGEMINEMGTLVRTLDPSRLIGECQIDSTAYTQETASWTTAESDLDVVGFNLYTGWYGNVNGATYENQTNRIVASLQNKLKKFQDMFEGTGVSFTLTEYGAGGNIDQHDDLGAEFKWGGTNPDKGYASADQYHPEEYQNYVHEAMYMALYGDEIRGIKAAENVWASFIWCMFDFSCYRTEGGTVGLNTKGLVTRDRQTKKDSFYLYKANWNDTDYFTHITSSRYEVRDTETIDVKVYSNCDSVELVVDGVSYGNGTEQQNGVFVWSDVQLKKDAKSHVEAIGTKDGEVVYTDTCDNWMFSKTAQVNVAEDVDLNKEYDGEAVVAPEYTVTVDGVDVTADAEVKVEWYKPLKDNVTEDDSENPGYDDGENPGYDDGENPGYDDGENPGYDDGENPGYDDGENPGYDDGENPGYDDGENPGYGSGSGATGDVDDDYDAAEGTPGRAEQDIKLDAAPTEVGKYYCLITVADGGNDEMTWLGSSLRIDFEITEAYDGCDGNDCPSMQFTDLKAILETEGYDVWWHPYTDYVIENELMIGMGDDIFEPAIATKRTMVTMVLWRLAGSPASTYVEGTYDDVFGYQWFAEPVAWATEVGVVEGYGNGMFGGGDDMKREDIVNMFYRLAQHLDIVDGSNPGYDDGSNPGYQSEDGENPGYDDGENPGYDDGENPGYDDGSNPGYAEDVLDGFDDADKISDYAVEAMRWAVESGLIQGYENNLHPDGTVDRDELAAFLYRWCEVIAK